MLGLAREADDHVGAHTGQRRQAADPAEELEEALGVAEAPHPPQHRAAGVLEGQVEVRRHAGCAGEGLDQPGSGLGRLEVADADPVHAVDGGQLGQQRLQEPEVAEVLAVGGGVLAHQEQLAGPLRRQPAGLLEHLVRSAADEGAAEAGDRAERAAPVAAAGQLEAGGRAGDEPDPQAGGCVPGDADCVGADARRAVHGTEREQQPAVARYVRLVGLPRQDPAQPVGDVGVVVEPQHGVGLGQAGRQLRAVPLGEATDRDDGPRASGHLEVGGLEQRVDAVLLGLLDEPARVDHDGVGVGRVLDQREPAGRQSPRQLLGVDLVAGAAQGHQRDGGSHRALSMPRGARMQESPVGR